MKPLFLFSLPRSGSTVLQAMLATHPQVATTSEPWLLLPMVYSMEAVGVHAIYRHRLAVQGIEDFAKLLPGGLDDYRNEMAEAARRLYRSASPDGARYFLDKTPRYALVADQILDMFPEAEAIVLWRNPLAIAASMLETFGGGRFNLHHYRVDLYDGLTNLIEVVRHRPDRVVTLRYEDVVSDPAGTLGPVFERLGLDADQARIDGYRTTQLPGRLGDKAGVETYQGLSQDSLDKWRRVLGTMVRKRWAVRYLKSLGNERLGFMGYDRSDLTAQVNALPGSLRSGPSDLLRIGYGAIHWRLNEKVFQHRISDSIKRLVRGSV